MPTANRTGLGLGIFFVGLGVSLLTTGGVGFLALRVVPRAISGEPVVVLATVTGGLLLAVGSAMVARSVN